MGKKLIILMGNIGTGKSTFAKNYNEDKIIINLDSIIEAVEGKYTYNPKKGWLYNEIEKALLLKALELGQCVLLDRTHYTKKSRAASWEKLDKADLSQYQRILIDFGKGTEESLKRRIAEPRNNSPSTWTSVHELFYREFQNPDEKELLQYDKYIEVDPRKTCEENAGIIIGKINE